MDICLFVFNYSLSEWSGEPGSGSATRCNEETSSLLVARERNAIDAPHSASASFSTRLARPAHICRRRGSSRLAGCISRAMGASLPACSARTRDATGLDAARLESARRSVLGGEHLFVEGNERRTTGDSVSPNGISLLTCPVRVWRGLRVSSRPSRRRNSCTDNRHMDTANKMF